jgi:signal transduction histidine kinase
VQATGGAKAAEVRRRPLLSAPELLIHAIVFGVLCGFIGLAYLAIPLGLGTLLGTGPSTVLSVAATAVVAIGFARVRASAQRTAQRIVYGARSSPYEVLAELSDRMAGAYATADVLREMAQILVWGTGAASATVWLRVGDELLPAAAWPEGPACPPVRVLGDELPALPAAHQAIGVRHRGELIGAVAVTQLPGSPLSPADVRLLHDFAAQAGLAVRNVRLTAELANSLDEISSQAVEIRASRRRIVDTQDAERRRVERDIHDGAQQYLVALMVQLRVARTLTRRDAQRAHEKVADLRRIVGEALQTLGELAQGIHPPVLTAHGLAAALRRQEAGPAVHVTVEASDIRRYPIEVEAAVYFACLEALNNAAKHAPNSRVVVRLAEEHGALVFSVRDDGDGFDPEQRRPGSGLGNMVDRVAALGGILDIASAPSRGTVVSGRVPLVNHQRGAA